MPQDEKAKEQPERDSAHHEEVHRDDPIGMIAQEGLPALRRRSPLPRHVFRHARLPDIDTELEELSVDPWRTPWLSVDNVFPSSAAREHGWHFRSE
jgi:hypothetical protein